MESVLPAYIENLIAQSDDALLILDVNYQIISANKQAQELLNTSFSELISSNFVGRFCNNPKDIVKFQDFNMSEVVGHFHVNSREFTATPVRLNLNGNRFSLLKLTPIHSETDIEISGTTPNIGLAISDSKGTIIFSDDFFNSLMSEKSGSIIGNTIFSLFPEDINSITEILQNVSISGESGVPHLVKPGKNKLKVLELNTLKIVNEPEKIFWLARYSLGYSEQIESQREFFYKLIHKSLPIGTALIKNGYLHFVNQHLAEITGYSAYELSELPIANLFLKKEDFDPEALNKFFETNADKSLAYNSIWKSACNILVEVSLRFTKLETQDNSNSYIMTVTDISESCKVRHDSERTEQQYKKLMQQAADGIIILEAEKGIITDINEKICSLTEYTAEELKGRHVSVLFPDYIDPEYLDLFVSKAWNIKNPISRADIVTKSGKNILIEINQSILEDTQGDLVIGFYRDLTDRKAWEQKLADSENKYQALFDSVQEGVVIIDSSSLRVIIANNTLSKILGYTKDFFENKHLGELLKLGHAEALQIERLCKLNIENVNNLAIKRKNDSIFYANLSATSFLSDNKTLVAVFITDVTTTWQYERELIQSKEKAEESDRLKSAFLANMSHEVRTPMNAIIGFSTLLDNESLDEERRKKYTEIIRGRCNDLLRIIDDILDISKIEAGLLSITPANFQLIEFMEELLEVHQNRIVESEKKSVSLILEPIHENITVYSDRQRLFQVLNNLIDNAVKFTVNGTVTLSCIIENEEYIQFKVRDTGIGIPEDKFDIIFHRFRQAEESLSRKFGGNGLGLAISKPLVELMGGRISFESELGVGSTFYVILPKTFSENSNPLVSNLENKSILLIEDDLHSVGYLKILLEQLGAIIHHIPTGYEALEVLKSGEQYDLILLDIQLEDISGLEVARQIRKFDSATPIIAETAYAMQIDRQLCIDAGCNDYLAKPIDDEELLAMLSYHICSR